MKQFDINDIDTEKIINEVEFLKGVVSLPNTPTLTPHRTTLT